MIRILVLLLFIFLPLSAKDTLTLAFGQWYPFHYTNQDSQHLGVDYKVIKMVFDTMGVTLNHFEIEWATQLNLLELGRVDLMRGAVYKDERAEFAHYSIPYRNETFSLFIWNDSSVATLSDDEIIEKFKKSEYKIAVNKGYYMGAELDSIIYKVLDPKSYYIVKMNKQQVKMFKIKRVDGFITERVGGYSYLAKAGISSGFREIELPAGEPLHVIFSKKNVSKEFVTSFNETLSRLKKNGALDEFHKEHKKLISNPAGF